MIDINKFRELCKEYPEVTHVEETDNGLNVIVRSKITLFDEEILPRIAIPQNLNQYDQEHKYKVRRDQIYRMEHHPIDAFCDPYCETGWIDYRINRAIFASDCRKCIELMIAYTSSLNVADRVIVRCFSEWVNQTKLL